MIKNFIISMRLKHWVKNFFVFIPILVSGSFFDFILLKDSLFAFLSFCLASSSVYFFNDIIDIEKDKNHPVKKNRPISSGKISLLPALFFMLLMLFGIVFIQSVSLNNIYVIILGYLILNFIYSLWLKKIPILDVICISIGFVLRVQAGVLATGLDTSEWLISMTFTLAMLLALGKRKVELENSNSNDTRDSLKGYSISSINSMQNIFISCTMIFYLLYTNLNTTFSGNKILLYMSSVFVISGLLRYVHLSFSEIINEDPTDILYKDKFIMISVILWALMILLSFWI